MKKLLLAICVLFSSFAFAQQPVVSASIDTNYLLIGEQTKIHLSVSYNLDGEQVSIQFPNLEDTISKELEIVFSSEIDTSYPDQNDLSKVVQSQSITITSFDSGYYKLPYFEFTVNGDSIVTVQDLFIDVQPVAVDTNQAIFDIKQPIEEPFSLADWLKENWIWIVGILVALIIIVVTIRYLKNKPVQVEQVLAPSIPPHERATMRLNDIKSRQVWKTGRVKQYHSDISETIRSYIEERYQIGALEHTTREIMQSLRFKTIDAQALENLNAVLVLADLVKFAKELPIPDENINSVEMALLFVEQTKLLVKQDEEEEND